MDEVKPDVHTMPNFGRPHVSLPTCWCRPTKDALLLLTQPQGPFLWIHNLES